MNDHTGKYEIFELHKQGTGPPFPTERSFVHLKTVSTGKHPQLTRVADLGHSVPEQE